MHPSKIVLLFTGLVTEQVLAHLPSARGGIIARHGVQDAQTLLSKMREAVSGMDAIKGVEQITYYAPRSDHALSSNDDD
jgi:hypothetical protein